MAHRPPSWNAATWQDKIFETPTVLLSGHVSGEEEVPVGVQALLFLVSLSHLLSYQLRSSCLISNLGYLWSTCHSPANTCHRQCWYEMLSQHQIFSAIVQCEHETLGCFCHAFVVFSTKFAVLCECFYSASYIQWDNDTSWKCLARYFWPLATIQISQRRSSLICWGSGLRHKCMTWVRMDTWTFRHFERPAVLGLQPFWVSDITHKDGSYMFI